MAEDSSSAWLRFKTRVSRIPVFPAEDKSSATGILSVVPLRADRIRVGLYAMLLVAMLIGGFEPFFFRIFFADRAAASATLTAGPDLAAPGYAAFLREVRERTPADARVAIFVPMRQWSGGYEYAYYRASYALAPREVIPLVDSDEEAHLERADDADYVAAWRMTPRIPGFMPAWDAGESILLERAEP